MNLLFISWEISRVIIIVLAIVAGLLILYAGIIFVWVICLEKKLGRDWDEQLSFYQTPINDSIAELSKKYKFQYVPVKEHHYKILKGANNSMDIYTDINQYDAGLFDSGAYNPEALEKLIVDFVQGKI